MIVQHTPPSLVKAMFGIGLLISVMLFESSSNLAGYIFKGETLNQGVEAANADHTSLRLLKEMVPGADSFSEKEGTPPVYKAYRTDSASGEKTLIGYAFVTPDIPPEPNGYSGPIDTLIGIDLEGNIVGLKAIYYKESHRYTLGDFLSFRRYRGQFIGKTAADKFRVDDDIDGISKATISVKAMSRGVRQSLRAVTKAYIK